MALDFAGNTIDRVNHGSDASLANLDPFTFMEWVFPQTFGADLGCGMGKANQVQKVLVYSGTSGNMEGLVARATTDSSFITNDTPLKLNAWNFVAWTFSSAAAAGQVQNIYVGSPTALATESSYGTATDGVDGVVDDASSVFTIANRGTIKSGDCKIAAFAYCNALLPLLQIQSWQREPRNLPSARLFSIYGTRHAGIQVDLSGFGNHGTVTGAKISDHRPLERLFPRRRRLRVGEAQAAAGNAMPMAMDHYRRMRVA